MGEAPPLRTQVGPTFRSGVPGSGVLRSGVDALLAVLLAPACAVCREPLDRPTRGAVCRACWDAIPFIRPPVCRRCGDPLASWRGAVPSDEGCPACRARSSSLSAIRAVGLYDGSLRGIVHALKYDGRRSVAGRLGTLMRDYAADALAGADAIVPVPLHRRRRRARGFNQAAELGRHLGLPICQALRRIRATPSQTDLPAGERHANVLGAFAVRRRIDVKGKCLVLVDDVSTTGATLEACARTLREAGAREVRGVIAARVASRSR
jgi:ComF family protein